MERAGLDLLANFTDGGAAAEGAAGTTYHREVVFRDVQLKNFGPFGGGSRGTITYPLSGRGLVLLRGIVTADTPDTNLVVDGASESNGAGKTSLVMSVLWALTGAMNGRVVNDGRAADVAYDSAFFTGSVKLSAS